MNDTLAKLNIRDGDVLVLRTEQEQHLAADTASAIVNQLYKSGIDDVLILVATPSTTLEALDEESMRAHGWVRASKT